MNDNKNCPFCKSRSIVFVHDIFLNDPACGWIECNSCKARGPIAKFIDAYEPGTREQMTWKLWNNQ